MQSRHFAMLEKMICWIMMTLHLMIIFLCSSLSASDSAYEKAIRQACETFAEKLVEATVSHDITDKQAVAYIENPSTEKEAPDFVSDFLITSFHTPTELYRAFLQCEHLYNNPENQVLVMDKAFNELENKIKTGKGENKDFMQWESGLNCPKRFEFDDELDRMKALLHKLFLGQGNKKIAVSELSSFLNKLISLTSQIRIPMIDLKRMCEVSGFEEALVNSGHRDDIILARDEGVLNRAIPLKNRLEYGAKWCSDMLSILFGADVVAPYIEDAKKFKTLKTHQGFLEICQKASEKIEEALVHIGKKVEGRLAWEHIFEDFLKSFGSEKKRAYAKDAIEKLEVFLKEEEVDDKKKDIYILSVMYALFDDLSVQDSKGNALQEPTVAENSFAGGPEKFKRNASVVSNPLYYRDLVKNLRSNKAVEDPRASFFLKIWNDLSKEEDVCLIKAPQTIYPAFACVWAFGRHHGLIGCPFGFDVKPESLQAHNGAYFGLFPLMFHDSAHFFNYCVFKSMADSLMLQETLQIPDSRRHQGISSAAPYYHLYFLAAVLNDRSSYDLGFRNVIVSFMDPEDTSKEKDILLDHVNTLGLQSFMGRKDIETFERQPLEYASNKFAAVWQELWARKTLRSLEKSAEPLWRWMPLQMQRCALEFFAHHAYRHTSRRSTFDLFASCLAAKYIKTTEWIHYQHLIKKIKRKGYKI